MEAADLLTEALRQFAQVKVHDADSNAALKAGKQLVREARAADEGPPAPEPPPTPDGKVLFSSDFTDPAFPGFYVQSLPGRATCAAGVGRFEVRPGDAEPDTGSQRSEVTLLDPMLHEGEELWVHNRFWWANDDTASPSWEVDHQWHDGSALHNDPRAGGSPPLCLQRYGNDILLLNGKGSPVYWRGPKVERGQPNNLLYRLKASPTDGELEAYWNGALVANFKGLVLMNADYLYLKLGVYRALATSQGTSVVAHDFVRLGTTRAAVGG